MRSGREGECCSSTPVNSHQVGGMRNRPHTLVLCEESEEGEEEEQDEDEVEGEEEEKDEEVA